MMQLAGRQRLQSWLRDKPTNFWDGDFNLQQVLRMYWGDDRFEQQQPHLRQFGAISATIINEAAMLNDRIGNHPRLERYSGIGERVEKIEFHPAYDVAGRAAYASGVVAVQAHPDTTLVQAALFYLLCYNGEMGHACPIACTAGLIAALQQIGSPELQARFLPPLLNANYDELHHGAQFMTEVQGGSDVGANICRATPDPDDPNLWHISGEKWFCSNINADQFLLTARPDDAPNGTRGLGLFLVPRHLDDGSVNAFHIRRLKEKIGTRTMASAEVDFVGAVAYAVGPLEDGFKNAVELVLNTSRYLNAFACCGMMARALLEARTYAEHRQAFGHPIIAYPLVAETIALMTTDLYANLAASARLAALLDTISRNEARDQDRATHRLLVNLNKMTTALAATTTIHRAIEVLGGNGAIEDFSILPRLYRDAIVLESWEGTHNVLSLQAMRDMARYRVHEAFLADLEHGCASVDESLDELRADLYDAIERTRADVQRVLDDPALTQIHARRVAEMLMSVAQGAYLLRELDWEIARDQATIKRDVVDLFFNLHLRPDYDPLHDPDYSGRVARIATNTIAYTAASAV